MQRRRRIKSKYMHRPKNLEWIYRRSPGLKNRIVFVRIHEVFLTVYKGNHTKSTSLIDRSMRLVGKLGLCRALGRWKQVKIACAKTVSLTTTTAVRRSHTLWLACMGWRTGREYGNLHWNNRSNLFPVIFTERQSHNWKTIFSRTWKRK